MLNNYGATYISENDSTSVQSNVFNVELFKSKINLLKSNQNSHNNEYSIKEKLFNKINKVLVDFSNEDKTIYYKVASIFEYNYLEFLYFYKFIEKIDITNNETAKTSLIKKKDNFVICGFFIKKLVNSTISMAQLIRKALIYFKNEDEFINLFTLWLQENQNYDQFLVSMPELNKLYNTHNIANEIEIQANCEKHKDYNKIVDSLFFDWKETSHNKTYLSKKTKLNKEREEEKQFISFDTSEKFNDPFEIKFDVLLNSNDEACLLLNNSQEYKYNTIFNIDNLL